jgi:hypothetical protein
VCVLVKTKPRFSQAVVSDKILWSVFRFFVFGISRMNDSDDTASVVKPCCRLQDMWLDGLYSITQLLDSKSRIQLGRSNRAFLAVGSHVRAWRDANSILISPVYWNVELPMSALLQHASIRLDLGQDMSGRTDQTQVVATFIKSKRHLRELTSDRWREYTLYMMIMSCPSLSSGIERLTLNSYTPSSESVSLMAHFSSLTALSLFDEYSSVTKKPSVLTQLHLAGFTRPLTRLSLVSPGWNGVNGFYANLGLPAFVSVEYLELVDWTSAAATSEADFQATFQAMHMLRKLVLTRVYGVNLLLPHVHHAINLRLLDIHGRFGFDVDPIRSMLAYPEHLCQALQANRLLYVTMDSPLSSLHSDKVKIYGDGMQNLHALGPRLSLGEAR